MSGLLMFYDTETTGMSDFKADYAADIQPCLLQLGYKVVDPQSRLVVFEIGHLVDSTMLPQWKGIHPDAQAIHHITEDMIRKYGIQPDKAYAGFQKWVERCTTFIAHNDQFDTRIMQCHAKRVGYNPGVFEGRRKFCTMQFTTNICKIPNARGNGNKWPKLIEAYCNLVDSKGFKDAHSALPDVNACEEIFWKLVDKGFLSVTPDGVVNATA